MDDEIQDDIIRDEFAQPDEGLLERVRALADGTLSPEEAERLLLEASASPDDALLMDAFREVHALTAVAEEPPPCRVTLDDVDRRIARDETPILRPWQRTPFRAAAAAVLLTGVALAAWKVDLSGGSESGGNVVADTAVVDVVAAPEAPVDATVVADVAAAASTLSAFVPFADGEPQWLTSLAEGRAVAKVSGRPVLLFIHHPTCPLCIDLRSDVFSDDEVQARLGEFVPVMVNVMEMPKDLAPFLESAWPYLGALDADGEQFAALPNRSSEPSTFRDRLDAALTAFGAAEPLAWGPSRALATRWLDAEDARARGELGRAWRELDALRSDDADGVFGTAARSRLAEIGARATSTLIDAESALTTSSGQAEALHALESAAVAFAGTPYEEGLRAVHEAWTRDGRFPRLRFTPEGVRPAAGDHR